MSAALASGDGLGLWCPEEELDLPGTWRQLKPTVRLAHLASLWVRWAFVGILGKPFPFSNEVPSDAPLVTQGCVGCSLCLPWRSQMSPPARGLVSKEVLHVLCYLWITMWIWVDSKSVSVYS